MKIEDINPNWTSEQLVERIVEEINERDLILYLSGLDDEGLDRAENRKKHIKEYSDYLEKYRLYSTKLGEELVLYNCRKFNKIY